MGELTQMRTPMRTRRDFLRLSAMAAAAGCVVVPSGPMAAETEGGLVYGVQMYMFRRQAKNDLPGGLCCIN